MTFHGEIPEFRRRYRYLFAVVGLTFTILLVRLCQMQIIEGDRYSKLSFDNYVQKRRISTVRGVILDRHQKPLVTNRPSYDIMITPHFVTEASIERIVELLDLNEEQAASLRARIEESSGEKRFFPITALRDISRDQLARFETYKNEIQGVSLEVRTTRNYLYNTLAAHILGYMNEVSASDLAKDSLDIYHQGDLIGRFGVERLYEDHLRGRAGWERVIVDARGRKKTGPEAEALLQGEKRVEPEPGHNIVLTVDLEVQRLVERALRNYSSGAAVVMEVNTGRILASASKPAFDPNLLSGGMRPEEVRRLINDPHRPLLDRVYRENYFPGSTYKVIPAIAAMEEGLVNPDDDVVCRGWLSFGRRNFRCGHAHGKVDLHDAIVQSCNIYFYTLAEHVGMNTMAHYARLFGLGAPTGIGLNGEVEGFIPTKEWYERRKVPFRLGFTLNAGIGQGNTKATPIQIASLYATIANGGTLYLPQIIERIENYDGKVILNFTPRIRRKIAISPLTLQVIHQALEGVVLEEKGTAHASRLRHIHVSGKTGTAQVNRRIKNGKLIWLPDHAWFAAYAPSENPVIAVAVLIEHGGQAAKAAAPVAMEIIKGYFKFVTPRTALLEKPKS